MNEIPLGFFNYLKKPIRYVTCPLYINVMKLKDMFELLELLEKYIINVTHPNSSIDLFNSSYFLKDWFKIVKTFYKRTPINIIYLW
jgi:hypothetical protein